MKLRYLPRQYTIITSICKPILYVLLRITDPRNVTHLQLPEESNRYLAKRLSFDHRAEDESEQLRIKDAGGFIARSRVLGILAVTRSFGDHGMKDFVTANPYTSKTLLNECGDSPFLILACDGVWDVLTDYGI